LLGPPAVLLSSSDPVDAGVWDLLFLKLLLTSWNSVLVPLPHFLIFFILAAMESVFLLPSLCCFGLAQLHPGDPPSPSRCPVFFLRTLPCLFC